jgi:hypothetical protein
MTKDIADLVVEDIKYRKLFGEKKYGVPLRANNGRDALQDLYEELLDAIQYLKQLQIEREEQKEKAHTYILMALNAAGVPEDEAILHARVATDSIYED